MIDIAVLKKLESQFNLKGEQCNAQDIAVFLKLLTRADYKMEEKTHNKLRELCDFLFKNFDSNCLRKMFTNFAEKIEKGTIKMSLAEILIRKYKILKKRDEIKGRNLSEIKNEFSKLKDDNIIRKVKRANELSKN